MGEGSENRLTITVDGATALREQSVYPTHGLPDNIHVQIAGLGLENNPPPRIELGSSTC